MLKSLQERQLPPFQGQQLLFYRQASAVSRKLPVASDYAMARNDDGNWIRAVRQPHRARGFSIADPLRQLPIRDCLPIGNVAKPLPNIYLESGAIRRQSQIEVFQLSCEIQFQLLDYILQRATLFGPCRIRQGGTVVLRKIDAPQSHVIANQQKWTNRRVEIGVRKIANIPVFLFHAETLTLLMDLAACVNRAAASRCSTCLFGPGVCHRYMAAYARHGRHSCDSRSSSFALRIPAACSNPKSLAGKASGSPKARIATYCAVQLPMPGNSQNLAAN